MTTDVREQVRERYAEAAVEPRRRAAAVGATARASAAAARSRRRSSVRASTRADERAGSSREGGHGEPRLRQPARRGRAPRGRDRPRPRIGRRDRRPPLREARRADTGTVYGLDMTDEMLALARANAAGGGRDERPLPQGPDRGHPARRRRASTSSSRTASSTSRRRRTGCSPRSPACCGRAVASGSPTSSPRIDLTPADRAERGSHVGCIAGAMSVSEYRAGLEAVGLDDVEVELTHAVADGMHGAIVRARKPPRA